MNPIDKMDELLRRVRSGHPIIGWTLTLLVAPIALALGLGLLALVFLLGPAIPIVAGVWLALFGILSAIGLYK